MTERFREIVEQKGDVSVKIHRQGERIEEEMKGWADGKQTTWGRKRKLPPVPSRLRAGSLAKPRQARALFPAHLGAP